MQCFSFSVLYIPVQYFSYSGGFRVCWIMTDKELSNIVLQDDENSENEKESSTSLIIRTIRHDDAMSVFNTCYK
jgi:hypothetical protein